jgi:CBS domain-containing protein
MQAAKTTGPALPMPLDTPQLAEFLATQHPYDTLPAAARAALAETFLPLTVAPGAMIYALGDDLQGLYLIRSGSVAIYDADGAQISQLGPRNSFGERGLMRDGVAVTSAKALEETVLLILPPVSFHRLVEMHELVARFFRRSQASRPRRPDLTTSRVAALMASNPLTCAPDTPVQEAARAMAARRVSSICVTEGAALTGIVTVRDLAGKVVGGALPPQTPVSAVMTSAPLTLPPSAIGSDVLHLMMERRVGHVPVVENGRLVGIVTQTDLTRFQAASSADLVRGIAEAPDAEAMAKETARIPQMLAQLVGAGYRHEVTTRLISDIADAATRRLLALAEERLGPAPVPYLWLACGSQGRQEQTGVSDQDNCLILHDDFEPAHDGYFEALARFVSDGLNTCGYVFCPGEMMATNPRWRQPRRVWQRYFEGWIDRPSPEAQMLASVMFDLRPVGGDASLFDNLQARTLAAASKNSIFVAHMVSNALTHAPPLGLLRGLATIRSGEHKNHLDLKMSGVVPVVDLGRIFALKGQLAPANTRARLEAAMAAGAVSERGGRDLLDAYDLIAETRLTHQATQVKAGAAPDNFLPLSSLSDFERSHLRNAFVVVKTMQAALGQGKAMLG